MMIITNSLNFVINGEKYSIPMAVEEPSVVAGASGAAKYISEKCEGFETHSTEPIVIG
jgi:hydroxymethylglutaryl-CoA reductase